MKKINSVNYLKFSCWIQILVNNEMNQDYLSKRVNNLLSAEDTDELPEGKIFQYKS